MSPSHVNLFVLTTCMDFGSVADLQTRNVISDGGILQQVNYVTLIEKHIATISLTS